MARRDDDDLGSAARALADAVAVLTRAVGQGLTEAGQEVGTQLATSLRDASRDLAEASAEVTRRTGEQRRAARAERTRTRLLEAARTVFAEKGYEGASVGDVAAQAGFTKGAVYANFGGKEDLLLAIARELSAGDVDALTVPPGRALTDVFALCQADPQTLSTTLLALEIYTYAVRHADTREQLAPMVAASWDHAAQLLATVRQGASPDTTDGTGQPSDGADGTLRPPADADGPRPPSDVRLPRADDPQPHVDDATRPQPTDEDRDVALALIAVHTFAQIMGPVLGDERAARSGARLIARLLADYPDHA